MSRCSYRLHPALRQKYSRAFLLITEGS
uniref:Uncharacterized protein n=1 Tax=Anguilla anguilla TaxID=7936 RepID=A0A0E9QKG6_ANGAN